MTAALKVFGILLGLLGILLTFSPDLFKMATTQPTGYEMIERRIKWGALIGLGMFLFYFQQWSQLGTTIWALLTTLALGIIIARMIGSFLDGFFLKQFLWLMIELIAGAIFGYFYWRSIR